MDFKMCMQGTLSASVRTAISVKLVCSRRGEFKQVSLCIVKCPARGSSYRMNAQKRRVKYKI